MHSFHLMRNIEVTGALIMVLSSIPVFSSIRLLRATRFATDSLLGAKKHLYKWVCPSGRPSVRPFVRPSVRPFVFPSIRRSVRSSVRPFVGPSVCWSVCPSVCWSIRPSVRWFVHLSVGPLRLLIFGDIDVLLSTAWPVLARVSSVECLCQPTRRAPLTVIQKTFTRGHKDSTVSQARERMSW